MNLIFATIVKMTLMFVGGGFTDHRLGRHFYTEEERRSYAEAYAEAYDDRTGEDI